MTACSTLSGVANRSSFADAEALCKRDRTECERQCSPKPQGINQAACDYILVERAEQEPEEYAQVFADVERICRDGIDRACRLVPDLRRRAGAQDEAVRAKVASLLQACGRSCGYSSRALDEASRIADSVLTALGTPHPCARGYEDDCALRRCGRNPLTGMYEECESQIAAAESKVADAEPEVVAAQHAAAAAHDKRSAMERRGAAYKGMTEECSEDLAPCKQRCAEDSSHDACIVVAQHMELGVGIASDVRKALKMLGTACEQGNAIACGTGDDIRQRANECATPEDCKRYCDGGLDQSCVYQRLPQLFAKCRENRQFIAKWKAAAIHAANAGNEEAASAAAEKLNEASPQFSGTLEELRRGIEVAATDAEGERDEQQFMKLILRVKAECSL
jgi:hypothetical protein